MAAPQQLTPELAFLAARHPWYDNNIENWYLWRAAYFSGMEFIRHYLIQNRRQERRRDYFDRVRLTHCPAMAKSLINEIKNSIYQRLNEISRKGGSPAYQSACGGDKLGVDRLGKSMNTFIGSEIIQELLIMSKVGIYVDMPKLNLDASLIENKDARPYIYYYQSEDILNWIPDFTSSPNEFQAVLLRDNSFSLDPTTGFPISAQVKFRHMYRDNSGLVHVDIYSSTYDLLEQNVLPSSITKIPFVSLEISDSLMKDIAQYQIGLLNLSSGDMAYLMRANFPIYTEQRRGYGRNEQMGIKPSGGATGDAASVENSRSEEVAIGETGGRAYAEGLDRPAFISPSTEPLQASLNKQAIMYKEMRLILNLTLADLQPKMASAESKAMDSQGLESGLSYIGLELEQGERMIAQYWAMYEGNKQPATINYPDNYSITTDADKAARITTLTENYKIIPSQTYKKSALKEMAEILLGDRVSMSDMDMIGKEIDEAKCLITDPEILADCATAGMVDLEVASQAAGFPAGTVEKAKADHAERLARIAAAQTTNGLSEGIGGVTDNPIENKQQKQTSQDPTTSGDPQKKVRGKGK